MEDPLESRLMKKLDRLETQIRWTRLIILFLTAILLFAMLLLALGMLRLETRMERLRHSELRTQNSELRTGLPTRWKTVLQSYSGSRPT